MTEPPDLHAQLIEKIDYLGPAELEVVNQFVDAINTDVAFDPGDGSSWLTEGWLDAFSARLRAHHALSLDPLSTTQFEAAFNSACMAESVLAWPNPGPRRQPLLPLIASSTRPW